MLETAEEQSGRVPATDILSSGELKGVGARGEYVSSEKAMSRKVPAKVPVNEDFLFDVDIEQRELVPVYWIGPVYEGRQIWRSDDERSR